jgi:CheY-like chemotaxis protein
MNTIERPTILLVEDDENDVLFMRRSFQKAGLQINLQIVTDGLDALAYFRGDNHYGDRETFPCPILTLLDLNIPYVHGLEVLRQMKQESPKSIVIILTSSAAESDMEAAYEFGANSYLLKPSTVEDRLDLVKEVGKYWLERNKAPVPAAMVFD